MTVRIEGVDGRVNVNVHGYQLDPIGPLDAEKYATELMTAAREARKPRFEVGGLYAAHGSTADSGAIYHSPDGKQLRLLTAGGYWQLAEAVPGWRVSATEKFAAPNRVGEPRGLVLLASGVTIKYAR